MGAAKNKQGVLRNRLYITLRTASTSNTETETPPRASEQMYHSY
jgi:hypothetical protein